MQQETMRPSVPGSNASALCDPYTLAFNASLGFTPQPAYITSDFSYRQRVDLHANSSSRSYILTQLPVGDDPSTWLQPYLPNTRCTWEIQAPPRATVTLFLR